jgi:antitoxin component YwqK of YwqJK toxin-antitoxin module
MRSSLTAAFLLSGLAAFAGGSDSYTEMPDLADSILLVHNGALPWYISAESKDDQDTIYYPSGQPKACGQYVNGKRSGTWTGWYANGQKCSVGEVKNGLPTGKWTFYYVNGTKKAEGNFEKGKFELGCAGSGNFTACSIMGGAWNFWYENGTASLACIFLSGQGKPEQLNGPITQWYSNGNKEFEGFYKFGERTGYWTWYYANGNRQQAGAYAYRDCGLEDYISHECPEGTWTYWTEAGQLKKKEEYVNGERVSVKEF